MTAAVLEPVAEATADTSIPLALIDESATNPRKHFDPAKLAELVESVKEYGVIQPIIVRPAGHRYELVCGHRRFRAAKEAGHLAIRAVVRQLSDKEVLELQVTENLLRADVHPLEDADSFERLIRDHGYTAEGVAGKLGKSVGYVYKRLKLCGLVDSAKQAMWDGYLSHGVGELIARIPDPALQQKATEVFALGTGGYGRRQWTVREALGYIEQEFMLRLSDAPWKLSDALLLPSAGSCTQCPNRTGNQKELFDDVANSDVCTLPACFKEKQEAHWDVIVSEAKAKGQAILPAARHKEVFGDTRQAGNQLEYNSPLIDADSPVQYGEKTWAQLLKKQLPPVTLARHPRTGRIFKLLDRKAAQAALKKAHPDLGKPVQNDTSWQREQRKAEEKRKVERSIEKAVLAEMFPKLSTLELNASTFRLLGKAIVYDRGYAMEDIIKRRGGVWPESWKERETFLAKWVEGVGTPDLVGVVAEIFLDFSPSEQRSANQLQLRTEFCDLLGIDYDAIEKETRAAYAEKKKAKLKKAKAAEKKDGKRKTTTGTHHSAVVGVCGECGCTETAACAVYDPIAGSTMACYWTDATETLCSGCAPEAE